MRQAIVVGNWKMFGNKASITTLVQDLKKLRLTVKEEVICAVCPPAIYINQVADLIRDTTIRLGAQNVFYEREGAFTGEISPTMLKDMGCTYVIIGHSERRQWFAETDAVLAKKFTSAYHAGLVPIFCLGETLNERKAGKTFDVVKSQLAALLLADGINKFENAILAYEPVWAIGTGLTASPEEAQAVHAYLRNELALHDARLAEKVPIIYGGSVKANNATELFAQADIDGGLIGGASLQAQEFISICKCALER